MQKQEELVKQLVLTFIAASSPIVSKMKQVNRLIKKYSDEVDGRIQLTLITTMFILTVFDDVDFTSDLPDEISDLSEPICECLETTVNELEAAFGKDFDFDDYLDEADEIIEDNLDDYTDELLENLEKIVANTEQAAVEQPASAKKTTGRNLKRAKKVVEEDEEDVDDDAQIQVIDSELEIISEIVQREDDFTELCEKYEEVDSDLLCKLMCLQVDSAFFGSFKDKRFDAKIKELEQRISDTLDEVFDQANDAKALNDDFLEVYSDHLREFAKKFSKKLEKIVEKAQR